MREESIEGMFISTHILTKRMTGLKVNLCRDHHISTHILTKRMTSACKESIGEEIDFNSHPHEEDDATYLSGISRGCLYFNSHPHEEDDGQPGRYPTDMYISTHILTKRMTRISCVIKFDAKSFQLTSSRRG